MKGYKGTNADMACRGFQFEFGKIYTAESVELCHQGFHFCKNLKDVFDFYENNGTHRFFEIEAAGVILSDGKKSVCSVIYFTRELTPIEINRTIYGDGDGATFLSGASVVRRWTNGKGIGGLVKAENKIEYTLDAIGDIEIKQNKILFEIPCEW